MFTSPFKRAGRGLLPTLIALSLLAGAFVASVFVLSISSRASGGAMPLQISSSAFSESGMIPTKYTCSGADVSPPLSWHGAPAGTKSFALIMDDPDAPAGTWVHWVVYNLSANTKELPEGVEKQEPLADGALQGRNDFAKIGYGGPCPPPGKAHRYFFKLYALNSKLNLKAGAGKADVERAMNGHIVGQAQLIGRYER
jgi:Raf kinase inhibitor-like YbhB/YbcL family protein